MDFGEQLTSASLDELKAVFDGCALDARGGDEKSTAIGFADCPDELIVWLVEQGLDVDASDDRGRTPLWRRAFLGQPQPVAQIPLLVGLGADIEARSDAGKTPLQAAVERQRVESTRVLLEQGASADVFDAKGAPLLLLGLSTTRNTGIADMAATAKLLLDRGATGTPAMCEQVERIGRDFEFHRAKFNPTLLAAAEAGLAHLYRLFNVTPEDRTEPHDGHSAIALPTGAWQEQHAALWRSLVPSSGPAETVQGEVLRITGRIADESVRNGGMNGDDDYRAMVDALPGYRALGNPLDADDLHQARELAGAVIGEEGPAAQVDRLSELAIRWVGGNPVPIPLGSVPYSR
ncbi:ankyrin repeat domain-containing protein [Brevibacterium rongguiense]|uniref:ankyrin repeat domain-containing protein n=1 Tax=Brevibacterium rongguiense TaxID=2695267 RepID=UPI002E2B21E8|nr:ankyrin repeat domain-containing protein [Brevibacterium rongguiense]